MWPFSKAILELAAARIGCEQVRLQRRLCRLLGTRLVHLLDHLERQNDIADFTALAISSFRYFSVQYLNNILEQDHRAIKRRVKAKQGFREFHAARPTIQGYDATHMIQKGQARWVSGSDVRRQTQVINKLFEVAP